MTDDGHDSIPLTKCTVISCPHYYHGDLPLFEGESRSSRFFPFPSDRSVASVWKQKCGVAADHPSQGSKVCSAHFRAIDYEDEAMTVLKADAVPRENLGWMIGMPEVKLIKVPKFEQVKEAVDTNEKLNEKLEKLLQEQKPLREKIDLYKKKIDNVQCEIGRLRGLIEKYPVVKRRNGKVETNLICKVFSQAQINMLLGKRKVVWSYDDMAMAFTLRHIGNKECYLYLKDTLNMPLPSLSAVQRWVASNKPKP